MVEIDLKVLAVQIITFLIGMLLLWKTGFRALKETLEKRREKIAQDLEAASQARQEVEKIKADFERQLAELKKKSQQMLDEAVKDSADQRIKVLEQAKAESKVILEKASQEIEREITKAKAEIKSEVASLAVLAAEKTMGKMVDQVVQKKLIDDFLKELSAKAKN